MSDFIFLRTKTETAQNESADKNKRNVNADLETDDLTEVGSAFDKISGYSQGYQDNDNSVFAYGDYSDVDHTVGDDDNKDLYA